MGVYMRLSPVALEPVGDLLQSADAVPGLPGAAQLVVLAPEEHHLRLHAVIDESGEHLVALIDGTAVVLKGVDEQRGGNDLVGVLHGAALPEGGGIGPHAGELLVLREEDADIADAVEGEPVGDGTLGGWKNMEKLKSKYVIIVCLTVLVLLVPG